MSFEFSLPNFQVETPSERRMYSYLYRMVQQLNWAMKHIQPQDGEAVVLLQQHSGTAGAAAAVTQDNFHEVKDLIIKSADIANAIYGSISKRLEGLYVAKSAFGDYMEATALELEASAKSISQNYSSLQILGDQLSGVQANVGGMVEDVSGLQGDISALRDGATSLREELGAMNAVLSETSAYIKTGVIGTDENGIPVYGLEIGQTNEVNGENVFNKYARFSSSRLSFYDQNDTEVAYISDYKLYITNVHITGTLTVGGYALDTSDGLAFRWMGGDA